MVFEIINSSLNSRLKIDELVVFVNLFNPMGFPLATIPFLKGNKRYSHIGSGNPCSNHNLKVENAINDFSQSLPSCTPSLFKALALMLVFLSPRNRAYPICGAIASH